VLVKETQLRLRSTDSFKELTGIKLEKENLKCRNQLLYSSNLFNNKRLKLTNKLSKMKSIQQRKKNRFWMQTTFLVGPLLPQSNNEKS
jgi:hypothetical protein